MYLFDTDTCVALTRGDQKLYQKIRTKRRDSIFVGTPTIYELELGVMKATQGRKKETGSGK